MQQLQPLTLPPTQHHELSEPERRYYLLQRKILIEQLGALEDLLGMSRTIKPSRERWQERNGYDNP